MSKTRMSVARKSPSGLARLENPAKSPLGEGLSKGEQTRRMIIAHALGIVSEVGYEGLSIGVLADETKLSKSGLFAHFKSKEALQLGVMEEVIEQFKQRVVRPALAAPRGEARLSALFEKKLEWISGVQHLRGCLLNKASREYDNRPGHPVRERLVQALQDWRELLVRCTQGAIEEGQLRPELDPEQFVYEFEGITMMYQQAHCLMRDRTAEGRALAAFGSLIERSRRPHRPR